VVTNTANIQKSSGVETISSESGKSEIFHFNTIENSNWLQFKYAIKMKVPVEDLNNIRLLNYIDEWYATRYKYGGESKDGIDCSAFTSGLLEEVFGLEVPRTCREQFQHTERIKKDELHEGDLVFFNIHRGISHVGVYLTNNKFVHASTSSGVMISDLGEAYFARRYAGAGRVETATP
jgi:lipoprotein Spr